MVALVVAGGGSRDPAVVLRSPFVVRERGLRIARARRRLRQRSWLAKAGVSGLVRAPAPARSPGAAPRLAHARLAHGRSGCRENRSSARRARRDGEVFDMLSPRPPASAAR